MAAAPPAYADTGRQPHDQQLQLRSASISSLPLAVLQHIFSFLPVENLIFSFRLVNKAVGYAPTMHLLRRIYSSSWSNEIQQRTSNPAAVGPPPPNYSTTPSSSSSRYPAVLTAEESTGAAMVVTGTRELAVYDLYICIAVLRSHLSLESDLYLLPSSDVARDLFDYMRPKACLEDTIIALMEEKRRLRRSGLKRKEDGEEWVSIRAQDLSIGTMSKGGRKCSVLLPFRSRSSGAAVKRMVVEVDLGMEETRSKEGGGVVIGFDSMVEQIVQQLMQIRVTRMNDGCYEWS